jgi:hypothetical protein
VYQEYGWTNGRTVKEMPLGILAEMILKIQLLIESKKEAQTDYTKFLDAKALR